ncbi:metallophosphoesterase [Candidatus Sumerlaeota bacterium]|nr:metallophosphoesterase [Candidatus Sumerlaeota bacterium]
MLSSTCQNTILLCGDLHCGKGYRAECADGLIRACGNLRPDAIVMAGDLTFRARANQFAMGKEILEKMGKPLLLIPGNHDIPLYDLVTRMLNPFRIWKKTYKALGAVSELDMPAVQILGLHTIKPFVHQKAFLTKTHRKQITDWMQRCRQTSSDNQPWRGVVMHQQLFNLKHHYRPGIMFEPKKAVAFLENAGIDFVLYGHVHYPIVADANVYFPFLKRRLTLIGSGTASNKRTRGPNPNNTFQLLTFSLNEIRVDTYAWNEQTNEFAANDTVTVARA